MARKIDQASLALVVTNEHVRTEILDALRATPDTALQGHLSIDGGHGRSIVYAGPLPAGTDKTVRGILRQYEGTAACKVSTIRNLPLQAGMWTTLETAKATKAAYTPKTPKADKVTEQHDEVPHGEQNVTNDNLTEQAAT